MSLHPIRKDLDRFKQIVQGKIKKELQKHIESGALSGSLGGKKVSIPVSKINLPRFTYGSKSGGVGAGSEAPGSGNKAGDAPGEHELEVDVSYDELADMLGEELQLPRIEPKGIRSVEEATHKYNTIRKQGPAGLRSFKRTYKQALKRSISSNIYDPDDPLVMPEKADRRYKSYTTQKKPISSACIIYMMDVSGSMDQQAKEIVRSCCFWIDLWIRRFYPHTERVFIVHDTDAKEVDENDFFHLTTSGGTKVQSAYQLCSKILSERFPVSDWNIYPFHFSDGDVWGEDDISETSRIIDEELLPFSNMLCYGQVDTQFGRGKLLDKLDEKFKDRDNFTSFNIKDKSGILPAIKAFLGGSKV